MESKLPLLITLGDPNGIGPEICLKLLARKPKLQHPYAIVGDFSVLVQAREALGISRNLIRIQKPSEAAAALKLGIPVLEDGMRLGEAVQPGKVTRRAGSASICWVRRAVEWIQAGEAAAVVTAPLCKEAVEKTIPGFQGHTEFIGEMCGDPQPVLALVHGDWVVAHVSTHVSLREACERVKQERILKVASLLNDFLRRYKGIEHPRIGVAGLNPHAGEGGLFGDEETLQIQPAVQKLRRKKIDAQGPLPADVVFPQLRSGLFDGVVAMYHDQGHVVTKTLLFQLGAKRKTGGVNTTLGLPVLRTSVDHGTGFDIAWQGKADPTSLHDALEMADRLAP
jgi:4-phospho-D-threonate 3-dehydrogenase / 4-phospho-D-erythronate 3-dehydrogenase